MIKLSIRGIEEEIPLLESIIRTKGKEEGIDEDLLEEIVIIITEICNNIIFHNYKNDPTKEIKIHIKKEQNNILIEIKDEGTKFDPIEYLKKSFKIEKGMGIQLVNKLATRFEYEYKDGNIYRIYKKIK